MKITIANQEYNLDIEASKANGSLKPVPPAYPLGEGDVYIAQDYSPLLLLKPFYNKDTFVIVGRVGLSPYSNYEWRKPLSADEVTEALSSQKYKYSHNINDAVTKLLLGIKIQ